MRELNAVVAFLVVVLLNAVAHNHLHNVLVAVVNYSIPIKNSIF
jgi:hypothetical protein